MTFDPKKLARPEILNLMPYSNGRGNRSNDPDFIWLDANENQYEEPPRALYPDTTTENLYKRLSWLYDIPTQNIAITRGSDEGIDCLCRAFCRTGKDAILISSPTFNMYKISAQIQGADTFDVPLNENWEVDFNGLQKTIDDNQNIKLVFFVTPQNPIGSSTSADKIKKFALSNQGQIMVIDEAYIEFSENASFISTINETSNIVVLRTLSKAYGLAGARIGSVVASKALIDILKKIAQPYTIPTPSADLALKALSPSGIAKTRTQIKEILSERTRLANAFESSNDIVKVFPSETNFLLVEFKNANAAYKKLLKSGIGVRDLSKPIPNCLRFTIGTPYQNDLVLCALDILHISNIERVGISERTTKETSIFAKVNLDQPYPIDISTGIGFFDHMLEQLSKHSGISITLKCQGDLEIDTHHTVEDTMITLGFALNQALGDKRGIGRYGFSIPMDETRADVLIDLSGREHTKFKCAFKAPILGELPTEMIGHAIKSLAESMKAAIHVDIDGENDHHKAEATFKGLAKALKMAVKKEGDDLPTTKGQL